MFSQELRLGSTGEGPFQWLAGAFYQQVGSQVRADPADAGLRRDLIGASPRDSAFSTRRPTRRSFRDLSYDFSQFAVFGEATYRFSPQWALTGGCATTISTKTACSPLPACSPTRATPTSRARRVRRLFAARDPRRSTRARMCSSTRRCRAVSASAASTIRSTSACVTPTDLVTFGGHPNWDDEEVRNYELGAKTRLADGRVTFNAAVFMTRDRRLCRSIADAGTCSSRIILNAEAETDRRRDRVVRAARTSIGTSGLSATYVEGGDHRARPRVPAAMPSRASVRATACRPRPSSRPRRRRLTPGRSGFAGELRAPHVQHVGSSFTQLADQEPDFGLITHAGAPAGSARLIQFGGVPRSPTSTSMPSCRRTIGNLRWGFAPNAGKRRCS